MKIIRNKLLPPKGYVAIMVLGFILAREDVDISPRTLRHEVIHKKQMYEMMILLFYVWYGIEYFVRLCVYRNHRKAYRNISFEREAYANDHHIIYEREPYAWLDYIIKKDKNEPNKKR